LAFMTVMLVYALFRRRELRHNYKISICKVTDITGPGWHSSGDYSIIYNYEVKHEKYSDNSNLNICASRKLREIKAALLQKYFPVAYDKLDPSTSNIILTQSAARTFNYKIPDSLMSIIQMVDCDFDYLQNSDTAR
jgi:hypothetical protein